MVGGLYEKNLQTGEATKYYRAFGRAIAMRTVPASGPQTVRYLLADHLGSTTAVVDSSGALLSKRSYWPYGGERSLSGDALLTDRWFTGQRDESFDGLGLYHYGARAMSTVSGRFLSPDSVVPDPMNPQSLNRYSYVLNNPLRYTDATGRQPWEPVHVCLIGIGCGSAHPNLTIDNCAQFNVCPDPGDGVCWGCLRRAAVEVVEIRPVGDVCSLATGNTLCGFGQDVGWSGRGLSLLGLVPGGKAGKFVDEFRLLRAGQRASGGLQPVLKGQALEKRVEAALRLPRNTRRIPFGDRYLVPDFVDGDVLIYEAQEQGLPLLHAAVEEL
jgi:RHS repeat-associated protein